MAMKKKEARSRRFASVAAIALFACQSVFLHGFVVGFHHPSPPNTYQTSSRRPSFCRERHCRSLQALNLDSQEIRSRLRRELDRLKEKDRESPRLTKEVHILRWRNVPCLGGIACSDCRSFLSFSCVCLEQELKVVYEDGHIIVIDKPSGVLTVPTAEGFPSLVEAVYDKCQSSTKNETANTISMDQMVVHRLGAGTSGLIVFAKTLDAVRGLNALFRTRKITRQYEVLVCGHVQTSRKQGLWSFPLMRDYEHPPYMRVSTDEHQRVLADLDPSIVGTKLLEAPKASLTHYRVVGREYLGDNLPVTRLILTSISGRCHQLNVHCAAFGHPIVNDAVYGYGGTAAEHGGLDLDQIKSPNRADHELQKQIMEAAKGMDMCVHANLIKFRHTATNELVEYTSKASF